MGCYLGARLDVAVPSWHVVLVGRPEAMAQIESSGLKVIGHDVAINSQPEVATSVEADNVTPARLVMLSVRADDVLDASASLPRLVDQIGIVMAVQNGVGTDDILSTALGPDRVVAAALTTSVVVREPGTIERTSRANGLALSALGPAGVPDWLVATWESAGMPVTIVDDPRSLRWSKLLLNMIGAPISAILDIDIGRVVDDPHLFRIEQLAFREATRVMDAMGVRAVNLPGYPVRLARLVMRLPRPLAQRLLRPRIAAARSGRSPGMRADLQRNRSEIEYFHGAIAAAGQRFGVRTSICAALADLMRDLVEHPDHRADFVGEPGTLVAWMQSHGVRGID